MQSTFLDTKEPQLVTEKKIMLLPPSDVEDTLKLAAESSLDFKVTMLDPWYNKGVGGVRGDYIDYVSNLLKLSSDVSPHVYLWGFPEIVALFIPCIPEALSLNCWLTWYYKNNPSVIRGWRSAQMTCLHLTRADAILYPEHFLNEAQLQKKKQGKLRYMPGPPSVIEAALNIGFVGKGEQTGHPSQKPEKVYEPLYKMTTKPGDLVLDPMCGSGTTGAVARKLGFDCVLADHEEEYVLMVERRLNITRTSVTSTFKVKDKG
ncbi:MAG TPA: site-specific DNA-methyltransferase [Desulfobacteria bacterium]|nr:site-specific DNA-methyltransferase [Desulfobacteria bacterium]